MIATQSPSGRHLSHRPWTSADLFRTSAPAGFAAGDTNLTRYVGNSPTNGVDPSGLQEKPAPDWKPADLLKPWKPLEPGQSIPLDPIDKTPEKHRPGTLPPGLVGLMERVGRIDELTRHPPVDKEITPRSDDKDRYFVEELRTYFPRKERDARKIFGLGCWGITRLRLGTVASIEPIHQPGVRAFHTLQSALEYYLYLRKRGNNAIMFVMQTGEDPNRPAPRPQPLFIRPSKTFPNADELEPIAIIRSKNHFNYATMVIYIITDKRTGEMSWSLKWEFMVHGEEHPGHQPFVELRNRIPTGYDYNIYCTMPLSPTAPGPRRVFE